MASWLDKIPGGTIIKSAGAIGSQFTKAGGLLNGLKSDEVTSKIKDCEKIIEKLPADQIPVSGTKVTQTGEFIQDALKAMKYGITNPDGVVGAKTVEALNLYIAEKNAPSSGFSFGSIKKGFSKATGTDDKLEPVKNASEIKGDVIEELIDDLRDGKHLPANAQLLQKLAESMYEIGGEAKNPELQKLGRDLSTTPLGAQSAIEAPENGMVAQAQMEASAPTGMTM